MGETDNDALMNDQSQNIGFCVEKTFSFRDSD